MNNYYDHKNLPQPVLPVVPPIEILKGQTALVTGANSGIGRAIAVALGKAGANVVINYVAGTADAEEDPDVRMPARLGGRPVDPQVSHREVPGLVGTGHGGGREHGGDRR